MPLDLDRLETLDTDTPANNRDVFIEFCELFNSRTEAARFLGLSLSYLSNIATGAQNKRASFEIAKKIERATHGHIKADWIRHGRPPREQRCAHCDGSVFT